MIQPEPLKHETPWLWSPGHGTDVWEMFLASMSGDLERIKRLVEKDPSLVRSNYEYRTPLSFAVRENQVPTAEFLLDQGADPFAFGDMVETAHDRGFSEMEKMLERKLATLHNASEAGEPVAAAIRERNIEPVRTMLDSSPALLHAGDRRSNQPIHWAVMTRQIDVIDELLARGANIDARRQDGARPLQLTNGDYTYRGWRDVPKDSVATPDDIYRHLVYRGAYVDINMAAAKGDVKRVRELLDEDPSLANRVADYNSYYIGCGAPLKNAAVTGQIEIVKLLLEHGADPNLPEESIAPHGHALYSAVYTGNFEIAKLLLEHGAYPNPQVESSADAVTIAIVNGDRKMIELLASYDVTWDIPMRLGNSLTYRDIIALGIRPSVNILAEHNDLERAEALFASDPSRADDPEALTNAAGHGHEDFVRLMLRHQPDLARRVTVTAPRAMATLLFEHGMDPSRPNWMGIAPLHRFAEKGDVQSATFFIEHGADVNARDDELCSTPLGYAARAGQTRMVEMLLEHGANPSLPGDRPWATPLAWAKRRGHDHIVRILERTGRGTN